MMDQCSPSAAGVGWVTGRAAHALGRACTPPHTRASTRFHTHWTVYRVICTVGAPAHLLARHSSRWIESTGFKGPWIGPSDGAGGLGQRWVGRSNGTACFQVGPGAGRAPCSGDFARGPQFPSVKEVPCHYAACKYHTNPLMNHHIHAHSVMSEW